MLTQNDRIREILKLSSAGFRMTLSGIRRDIKVSKNACPIVCELQRHYEISS